MRYADNFRNIDCAVKVLFKGQLICPHPDEKVCVRSEHLTISEAKECAAGHFEDEARRTALWMCVFRGARNDTPGIAVSWQLLGVWFVIPYMGKHVYKVARSLNVDVTDVRAEMIQGALRGIALADERADIRHQVVSSALAAGWKVGRADPVERSFGLPGIIDSENLRRNGQAVQGGVYRGVVPVGSITRALEDRIAGERLGSVLHGMGILDEYLSAGAESRVGRGTRTGRDVNERSATGQDLRDGSVGHGS